jgi:hypothetical protein
MVLSKAYMQEGLPNRVSISRNSQSYTDRKWNTKPINLTEKLTISLLKPIPIIYFKYINFMKLSNRLNNIKLPYPPSDLPIISLPMNSGFFLSIHLIYFLEFYWMYQTFLQSDFMIDVKHSH